MIATHNIEEVSFSNNNLCIRVDGHTLQLPLHKVSPKLEKASLIERNFYTISPSGYGIHWPLIDEDLAIDALLKSANL
jgi:hypothetical protein